MTMSFLLHDSLSEIESTELSAPSRLSQGKKRTSGSRQVTVLGEKLRIPSVGKIVSRNRLLDLLEHSIESYGATLITGRAGTGKTTLAADFASSHKNASWYTIEPADSGWKEFSASFFVSLFGPVCGRSKIMRIPNDAVISEYLTDCFARLVDQKRSSPHLIVLDNVHHLFDAGWFAEFFRQLIISLNENARLLMLCRSRPTAPLWRLRSKQMLNVIDENLLGLTADEAVEICRLRGIQQSMAKPALGRSYGRVSAFLKALDDRAA